MEYQVYFQPLGRVLNFGEPAEVLVATSLPEVRPLLRAVEQATGRGFYAVGYVSYEAAPAFDPALTVRADTTMPLAWFALFQSESGVAQTGQPFISPLDWQPLTSREQYDADITTIREAIAAGDTYQVNYTLRLHARFAGDGAALFQRLWSPQAAPYAAYLDTGRFQIVSLSPELFFHRRDGTITTRPMKGTAWRGRWLEEDTAQAAWLAASEKNRAENLMIVDLLRNDLGRIAEIGTVRVPELFTIERYATVWQMTSTVEAHERPGTTLDDVFGALFPCGSVTGAPKVSTMRLITMLEQQPRQVYCGAIGVVLPGGEAIFNVAIRTAVIDGDQGLATYGVGGGVTFDSTPADEYAETVAKAAVLREPRQDFALLETLRCKYGRYTLLEQHLARLADSARYFGIPVDLEQVRQELYEHTEPGAQNPEQPGIERVRLLVSQQGDITVERAPLVSLPPGPLPVALVRRPVSPDDRFLFHKTTNRAVYETAREGREGVFDVLLWNEVGEVTEFTIGNLVVELDGRRWTPARESGLLNGVLREVLLRRGTIAERVLTLADVRRATRLWLINSVRGWVDVRLVER